MRNHPIRYSTRRDLEALAEQGSDGEIVIDLHDGRTAIRHASDAATSTSLIEYADGHRDVIFDSHTKPVADPQVMAEAQASRERAATARYCAGQSPEGSPEHQRALDLAERLDAAAADKAGHAFDGLKNDMNRDIASRHDTDEF
ncbi:hypothetical protein DMB66_27685 [Actinoplanes sp. ATCC 53533]|uniref:hypothetical protein n=1 Tax=Actinoplanes sp. ATCC 53533 TaxID=1288362 RepID=UPI000F775A27|nr:hypothetical protein [Actinoplanes sp. ATCC 53533]RSM59470.1 hypothetical protein DMB66_27685 [Actinoplanes sp. ATCC 53533]